MDYISSDRKKIGTKEEILQYEATVEAEKVAKAKLAEEKQTRKAEIEADYKAWVKKVEKYNEDYNEPLRLVYNSSHYSPLLWLLNW